MKPHLRKLVYWGFINDGKITPRARGVLTAAKRRARDSRSAARDIVFSQILELEDCTALKILQRMGYTRHMLATHVQLNLQRHFTDVPPKKTLARIAEFAFTEGARINHGYLGTEHLLLGILRDEEESHEASTYGISLSRAREEIIREFSAP